MNSCDRAFILGSVGDDVHIKSDAEIGDVVFLPRTYYEY